MQEGKIGNESVWHLSKGESGALRTQRTVWPKEWTWLLVEQCDSRMVQGAEERQKIAGIGGPDNAATRDLITRDETFLTGMMNQAQAFEAGEVPQLTTGSLAVDNTAQ